VEKITSEQDHVYITFFGELDYLVECLRAVLTSNSISLVIADMIVRSNEDADGVRGYYTVIGLSNTNTRSWDKPVTPGILTWYHGKEEKCKGLTSSKRQTSNTT